MTDNVTIDNGGLSDFDTSTDYATSGHIQRVKLTYSADGDDTHIPADADGLLVNAGVVDVGADVLALASGTAIAVGLYDDTGAQVTFAAPSVISVSTGSATTYAAGDAIGTVMSFANAAAVSGGTGNILRATFYDFDDLTHDGTNGRYRLDLYTTTVSVTDDASYAATIDDTEAGTYIGSIDTDDAGADGIGWVDLGASKVCTVSTTLPLAYACAATTLFGVLVCVTLDSGATTANGKRVDLQVVAD